MNFQALLIAAAVAFWITLVVGAFYLDAKLGGWRSLREKYPSLDKQLAEGETWFGESVILANGGSAYKGLLMIRANQVGMTLEMPFMFRWLYPDLFLPWKDVAAVRERGFLWDKVHLTFMAVPDVPVTISASLADKILRVVGPVWSESPQKPAKSLAQKLN